ncbi:pyruvoyl-dependent arginine decarboxylase [Roseiconus nitratireducens]
MIRQPSGGPIPRHRSHPSWKHSPGRIDSGACGLCRGTHRFAASRLNGSAHSHFRFPPGQVLVVILAGQKVSEPHRMLAASVGLAVCGDRSAHGSLSEHHSLGQCVKDAGNDAEALAATTLASTLDVEFDEQQSWMKRERFGRIRIRSSRLAASQSAAVKPDGH